MSGKVFQQHTQQSRFIRLLLVFALILVAGHVALHDLDESGTGPDAHGECQLCRIAHVPASALSTASLAVPVAFLLYRLSVANAGYRISRYFHTRQARAPPLF